MKNGSNQYIISLGAGQNQVPLIKTIRSMGYRVLGVDRNIQAPGFEYCDIKIEESVSNYRKIVYKLGLNILDAPIAGGVSASYGGAVLSWAYIAEKLKLIGPPRPITELMLDKYEARKKLKAIKHPLFKQPRYYCPGEKLKKSEVNALKYPIIVKPRAGHGKMNIAELKNYDEVKTYFTRRHLHDIGIDPQEILLEEKVAGDEITVTGLVQNFQFTLAGVSDKQTSERPPFIELEHNYPSKHRDLGGQIREIHQMIVEHIQLSDCPVVSEWKVVDGKIYLIEFSLQTPGEYLAPFLLPKAAHYNYYENLVRLAVGETIDKPPSYIKTKKGRVRFLTEVMSQKELIGMRRRSDFFYILNENPQVPPLSNSDRYAVLGEML